MSHQVRISRRAHHDLQAIYDYVAREAPATAGRLIDELYATIGTLETHPRRGARPRDPALRERGYRFLVQGDFLVLYAVVGRMVRIRRVVRGARAYRNML